MSEFNHTSAPITPLSPRRTGLCGLASPYSSMMPSQQTPECPPGIPGGITIGGEYQLGVGTSSGTSGSSGTSSTSGTSGSSGTSGTSGINGTSGTAGAPGTSGTSGMSGTSGITGNDGTSGSSGTSGTSATSGTSGTSGAGGTSGIDGTSGTSATSGTSGSSATSGTSGTNGAGGKSAYELAVEGGYVGSEAQWIAQLNAISTYEMVVKFIDDATLIITGDAQVVIPITEGLNGKFLSSAHASVSTVSSGGLPTFQVRNITNGNNDMLSTPVTIDVSEFTSYTADVQPVVNPTYKTVATGDQIAIDIDVAGTGTKGACIILKFTNI